MTEEIKEQSEQVQETVAKDSSEELAEFDPGVEIPDHVIGSEIKPEEEIQQDSPEEKVPESPKTEDSQTPEEGESPAAPEGYDDAIVVLKRAKFSQSVIEKLSPEEVVEQAQDIRPIQLERDRMGNDYMRLRNEFDDLRSKVVPDKTQDVQPDLSIFSSELSNLKNELGDEPAAAMEAILSKQAMSHHKEMQALQESVRGIESARIDRDLSSSRESLLNDFPRLKSKETYDRVFNRLVSLNSASDSNNRYGGDLTALMRDAAILELGSPVTQSDKDNFIEGHKNRIESQPTIDTPSTSQSETFDDLDDLKFEIFQAKEKGDTERVARLRTQLPNQR